MKLDVYIKIKFKLVYSIIVFFVLIDQLFIFIINLSRRDETRFIYIDRADKYKTTCS